MPRSAGVRVDRRPAARARRAPRAGDLRSHPQAHQGPADHGALHDHAAADAAPGTDRVHGVLGARSRTSSASGSASTRRRRARSRRSGCGRRIAQRVVAEITELYAREPKLHDMRPSGRARATPPAAESGRVHLRADDGVPVGGSEAADHAVPVRRRSGLHAVRLHGVGRARGARPLQARRRAAAAARSSLGRSRSERLGAARRWRRRGARRRAERPRAV